MLDEALSKDLFSNCRTVLQTVQLEGLQTVLQDEGHGSATG
jgi:hypothetical protein